jgi:hypothetical protein
MSRLITFGCSFTYGQGLPNCEIGNNETGVSSTPSEYAWPAVLGKLLKIETVNKGIPGASNLEILYQLLNFKFKKDDTVVIMWSLPVRDLYFISNSNKIKPYRQLGLWLTNKTGYVFEWLRNVKLADQAIKSWIYIQHADLYLDKKNIKYIHFPADPKELLEYKPEFINDITNLYVDGQSYIDACVNDNHPGVNSHIETAKKIYKILNEK